MLFFFFFSVGHSRKFQDSPLHPLGYNYDKILLLKQFVQCHYLSVCNSLTVFTDSFCLSLQLQVLHFQVSYTTPAIN